MAVFREVTLQWRGEDYTMTPSVALLRRIKSQGVNNLRLAHECLSGGVDPSELAVAHHIFLKAAGAEVSENDSYEFLTEGNMADIVAFQEAYVQSVIPSVDLGKKPEARTKSPATARAKKETKGRK